ncbi:AAA family ATPase [Microbacteriaceae bacterium K1510]|nr:AAA family ATPase [Microbacteriaceae bacterium K1510]
MTAADESISIAVAALRSWDQPATEGLNAAPIVDGWAFHHPYGGTKAGIIVTGTVAGSAKFADGALIFTSKVRAVDGHACAGRPAWAQTQNTLYRLGWPHVRLPPVLQVALAPNWGAALLLAREGTGEHTLPQPFRAASAVGHCDHADDANSSGNVDWPFRRKATAEIAKALVNAGRHSVADAWHLLSTNARFDGEAKLVSALLEAAAENVEQTPEIKAALAGWQLLANGTTLGEDITDPIVAARRIGERHTHNDGMIGTADDEPPLFVRMVRAKDWWSAADLLIEQTPSTVLGTATPFVRDTGSPKELREAARLLANVSRDRGQHERATCWQLLSVDPTGRTEVDWVIEELTTLQRAATPPHDLTWVGDAAHATAAWKLLAAWCGRPLPQPDDAIASAWGLYAFYTDAIAELADGNAKASPPSPAPDATSTDAPAAAAPHTVLVLPTVGGTRETSSGRDATREFKAITGKHLPLVVARDLAQARTILREEFPHLHAAIDVLLAGLVDGEPIRLRPTLLVGEAGGGKSRLARRLAETLGLPLHRFDGSGSADNTFAGTSRRWSTGEHCTPLEAIRRHRVANPLLLVDEIDKAGVSPNNGALTHAILPFVEPENARAYPDPFVESEIDLSHVNYILTANTDIALPGPLRDRLRIVRLPRPAIEHLPQLARGIVADVARERGGDPRWWPDLDDGELAVAEVLWRGGSVRRLRAIVERLLAHREERPRH